jgi:hypothetical protein
VTSPARLNSTAWRTNWVAFFYVPIGIAVFTYAGIALQGLGTKAGCATFVIGLVVLGETKRRTRLTIDDEGIALSSPRREWRVSFEDIVRLDKAWRSDRITGIKLSTRDGRRLLFGLTDYRDDRALARELLVRTPHDRVSADAFRLLTAVSEAKNL